MSVAVLCNICGRTEKLPASGSVDLSLWQRRTAPSPWNQDVRWEPVYAGLFPTTGDEHRCPSCIRAERDAAVLDRIEAKLDRLLGGAEDPLRELKRRVVEAKLDRSDE